MSTFERAELPVFSPEAEPQEGTPPAHAAAWPKPHGGPEPVFGNIPYPPREGLPWHPVPACRFSVLTPRVTALYGHPVIELRGMMHRDPSMLGGGCPPGTENYTHHTFNLWAMVQAEVPSVWSLRSEANYEQKLFGGQPSPIAFIPFVPTGFDKSGGFLSYYAPARGRMYGFSVWLRDATNRRDLSFLGPQGPRPLGLSAHVP